MSLFSDNGLEMKVYLNEEIAKLKQGLESCKKDKDISSDNSLKEKIDRNILYFRII